MTEEAEDKLVEEAERLFRRMGIGDPSDRSKFRKLGGDDPERSEFRVWRSIGASVTAESEQEPKE